MRDHETQRSLGFGFISVSVYAILSHLPFFHDIYFIFYLFNLHVMIPVQSGHDEHLIEGCTWHTFHQNTLWKDLKTEDYDIDLLSSQTLSMSLYGGVKIHWACRRSVQTCV